MLTWLIRAGNDNQVQYRVSAEGAACIRDSLCLSRLKALLQKHGGRLTNERIALLEVVCSNDGHFLPEEIARESEVRGNPVSLTTVYRNIPLLLEAGIIRRVPFAVPSERDGVRYERILDCSRHDHLTCVLCGRRIEFAYPAIGVLQQAVAREHGFTLENNHLELLGTCSECSAHRNHSRTLQPVPPKRITQRKKERESCCLEEEER
jgi:Fe2+ or Zn2+ uptake regulation protein